MSVRGGKVDHGKIKKVAKPTKKESKKSTAKKGNERLKKREGITVEEVR